MADFDPVYTQKKAAEYLAITPRTLRKLTDAKAVKCGKYGKEGEITDLLRGCR